MLGSRSRQMKFVGRPARSYLVLLYLLPRSGLKLASIMKPTVMSIKGQNLGKVPCGKKYFSIRVVYARWDP